MSSPGTVEALNRPTNTNRQCIVCKATVAAWPNAMVCHCYGMPWVEVARPQPEGVEELVERIKRVLQMRLALSVTNEQIDAAAVEIADMIEVLARCGSIGCHE